MDSMVAPTSQRAKAEIVIVVVVVGFGVDLCDWTHAHGITSMALDDCATNRGHSIIQLVHGVQRLTSCDGLVAMDWLEMSQLE